MRRYLTFAVLILLAATVLLSACGGGNGNMEVEERSYAVETTVATAASTTVKRELSGILRGEMEAMVAPEISGRLSSILVDVGDFIDTDYGLEDSGNDIRINLAATSGLEFDGSGQLQIEDAVAGDGLTISSKVMAVMVAVAISGAALNTLA